MLLAGRAISHTRSSVGIHLATVCISTEWVMCNAAGWPALWPAGRRLSWTLSFNFVSWPIMVVLVFMLLAVVALTNAAHCGSTLAGFSPASCQHDP
jgi:hypothetical protein